MMKSLVVVAASLASCSAFMGGVPTPMLRSGRPASISASAPRTVGGAGVRLLSRQVRMMSSEAAAPSKVVFGAMKELFSASDESAPFRVEKLNKLKEDGVLSKWNSVELSPRMVSKNELRMQVKTEMELDELMGLTATDPDLQGITIAAFGASAVIGVGGSIIGGETGGAVYWVTYLGASIPLVLIGVGSVAPGLIGDVINKLKWQLDPTNTKERRVRHEAAHMLCGYMCGLPVQAYQIAPEPLCQFYDRAEGNFGDIEAWKRARGFNKQEVAALSVVSCSGLMGELTKFSTADGGQQDLVRLAEVYFQAEGDDYRKQATKEGNTRWGAYKAMQILKDNEATFERLYQAMDAGKSVEECIAVIEGA